MSKGFSGFVVIAVIFLIGAWAGQKWPNVNLINKITG